jgi:hypothetical protein
MYSGETIYTYSMPVKMSKFLVISKWLTVDFILDTVLDNATAYWWQELEDYGIDESLNLTRNEFDKGIGHFTQMASFCELFSGPSDIWILGFFKWWVIFRHGAQRRQWDVLFVIVEITSRIGHDLHWYFVITCRRKSFRFEEVWTGMFNLLDFQLGCNLCLYNAVIIART